MITLVDGPAAGTLSLRQAPLYLRATIGPRGKRDALDQPDDEPSPTESIHVYERTAPPEWVHIRGAKSISGMWPLARYTHRPDVDGEQLRDTEAWRTWCRAQPVAQLEPRP